MPVDVQICEREDPTVTNPEKNRVHLLKTILGDDQTEKKSQLKLTEKATDFFLFHFSHFLQTKKHLML